MSLKPCPFCGSDDIAHETVENNVILQCVNCEAQVVSEEAWNLRALIAEGETTQEAPPNEAVHLTEVEQRVMKSALLRSVKIVAASPSPRDEVIGLMEAKLREAREEYTHEEFGSPHAIRAYGKTLAYADCIAALKSHPSGEKG